MSINTTHTVAKLKGFKLKLLHVIWFLMCPFLLLLLPQAVYVKRTTLRLPEAQPISPQANDSDHFRLVHIGESTVAGVGVTTLDQGFTANLANHLSKIQEHPVQWHTLGINGIRLKALMEEVKQQGIPKADLLVVSMGANDTTGLTHIHQWQQQLKEFIRWLKQHDSGTIVFTQVPPMLKFPALPAPLRYWVGLRAMIIDGYLQRICTKEDGVFYVATELNVEPEFMAEDGYHPSAKGYQKWAEAIAPELVSMFALSHEREQNKQSIQG